MCFEVIADSFTIACVRHISCSLHLQSMMENFRLVHLLGSRIISRLVFWIVAECMWKGHTCYRFEISTFFHRKLFIFFRVVTISADAGFYIILALRAKHSGSDDPTYVKKIKERLVSAECVENSPQHWTHLKNGVSLPGLNQTVWESPRISKEVMRNLGKFR